ncbi:MAG: nucleoside hydrolase [Thermogutta sp.]|uniref:nucleoside hydrolase n=1 Tax=Thermogutta sp. TaxID=1962930 RepID=UPI0019A2707A|nr:nucleoside hydrolase [Thermogutta sp.]MBC7351202.1 nucleoside hydrolase [Thermogutta sp.]
MSRKIIIDFDPGIDDALALCLLLFDPEWEVVAVTAVGGNVSPAVANRNVQALIAYLDPPRIPRIGVATAPDEGLPVEGRFANAVDDLRDAELPVAELRTPHPSEKVLADEVRAAPHEVTVLALGPLTNLARAMQKDPDFPSLVHRIIIAGGAVQVPGNITPAAEFNIYCDPRAAKIVFASRAPKTLIPLDVTNRLSFSLSLLNDLPPEETKIGALLRKILPAKFRAYRQQLGLETIHLHDTITYLAACRPDLLRYEMLAGDVESTGEITRGATIFDRRPVPAWRDNRLEVAMGIDAGAMRQEFFKRLRQAAEAAGPLTSLEDE